MSIYNIFGGISFDACVCKRASKFGTATVCVGGFMCVYFEGVVEGITEKDTVGDGMKRVGENREMEMLEHN